MVSKPTLVLVPGSFTPATGYDPLAEAFAAKGYSIKVLDLRTVGKKPGTPPTMYDDAAYINSEVAKLADEGKEVVLVAHSYGGIPTSESLKGVSKEAREKEGKKGGVVRVAYLTALVPEVGTGAGAVMEGQRMDYNELDADGWLHLNDHETVAKYVFSDLSLEEGVELVKSMSQHSAVSFANDLTYAGYKDVPVSYLFCENDKCVPPFVQQRAIDNVERATGKKVDVTRIPTDHVPTVSAPGKVVDWFVALVEKGGKE